MLTNFNFSSLEWIFSLKDEKKNNKFDKDAFIFLFNLQFTWFNK